MKYKLKIMETSYSAIAVPTRRIRPTALRGMGLLALALMVFGAALCPGQDLLPKWPEDAKVVRDGAFTRVESAKPWTISWKQDECQMWTFGPVNTRTFHIGEHPEYRPFAFVAPLMWAVKWDPKTGKGLWMKAEPGPDVKIGYNKGTTTVSIASGAMMVLAQTASVQEGHRLAEQSSLPVKWEGLKGTWRGLTIKVDDRNGDGKPDQVGDRWHFLRDGKRTMVLSFGAKAQDPRKEGAFCLISTDLNKDGQVDDSEIERPTYKLVDQNSDGRFLAGNLLEGGRLEQDVYYYNPEGSPEGVVWIYAVRAFDLDGDGDQDATERRRALDYAERGEGGGGTAVNQEGVMLDYADRPFSEVLQIDPGAGTVKQCKIGYDYYLFADNACSMSAAVIDPTNVLHTTEEHMQYKGFHNEYGMGHLWTCIDGGMHRIIVGELGGKGGWKMGVDFDIGIAARLPHQIVQWRTPWGQELKFVSYFAPLNWDGKRLEGEVERKEHWDYSKPSPWGWAMQQTIASTTTIEPNDVPGQAAFEAYLGGTCDRSRQEYSPEGGTTFRFYYSPLMSGLHHRGALNGHTLDNRLLYWDLDGDGVMETYAWDADRDGCYSRRLWFERKTSTVTLWNHGKLFVWTIRAQFPETDFGLENFGELDRLYRLGNADQAMVMSDIPAIAKRVPFTPMIVGLDHYHGGDISEVTNTIAEGGMGFLGRSLALTKAEIRNLEAPFSAASLEPFQVMVLANVAKPIDKHELKALQKWVLAGGTLVLAPAGEDGAVPGDLAFASDQLAAFRQIARLFKCDFTGQMVDADFMKLRIPDQQGIINDIKGEKFPTEKNRIERFSGRKDWLNDLLYLAVQGYAVQAKTPLLKHDDVMLVGETPAGEGKILLVGGSLFCNRFCNPPFNSYQQSRSGHPDNRVLGQRIAASLVNGTFAPYLARPADPPRLAVKEPPWQSETVEGDVLKFTVYPEIGGRLLWLGRKDSGVNHLRVEAPDYSAGPPTSIAENAFVWGRNYGGIWDVGWSSWPGLYFFSVNYHTEPLRRDDERGMTVTGEAEGVQVRRDMRLPKGEAAIEFDITEVNVSPLARRMMIRLQTEFQAGPDGVDIFWPSDIKEGAFGKQTTEVAATPIAIQTIEEGIKKLRYVRGSEENRGLMPFKGAWAAAVDHATHELILHRADPALKPSLFYWAGANGRENEDWIIKEYPSTYSGFYCLQFFYESQIVNAGQSIRAPVRMEFYRGLDGLNMVGERYVGELWVSQTLLGTGEKLSIRPRLATPSIEPALGTTVRIQGPAGFKPLEQRFESTTAKSPGEAREWTWTLPTEKWPDGEYTITMTGPDGQTGHRIVKIDAAGHRAANARLEDTRRSASKADDMAKAMTGALLKSAEEHLRHYRNVELDADLKRVKVLLEAGPEAR